jgi:DNA-binding NarL/FixJ family response regulator
VAISILLVEKNEHLRKILASLLYDHPGVRIAPTAQNVEETERLLKGLNPDVAIVDVHLDDFDVVAAFRRISKRYNGTRLLASSNIASRSFAEKILRAGACGYLLKDCALEELTTAVRAVHRNETYASPRIRAWAE